MRHPSCATPGDAKVVMKDAVYGRWSNRKSVLNILISDSTIMLQHALHRIDIVLRDRRARTPWTRFIFETSPPTFEVGKPPEHSGSLGGFNTKCSVKVCKRLSLTEASSEIIKKSSRETLGFRLPWLQQADGIRKLMQRSEQSSTQKRQARSMKHVISIKAETRWIN